MTNADKDGRITLESFRRILQYNEDSPQLIERKALGNAPMEAEMEEDMDDYDDEM